MPNCKLYTPDQIVDGKPTTDGIDLNNSQAVREFLFNNNIDFDELAKDIQVKTAPIGKREYKSVVTKAISQTVVSNETKQNINNKDITYQPLSNEEAKAISTKLVEDLGGADKAMAAVREASNTDMPPVIKVMIAGQVQQQYAELVENAQTQEERDMFAEQEADIIDWIDNYARDLGRGVQAVSYLYKQSQWGLENFYKKRLEAANKTASEAADKPASDIAEAVNKTTKSVSTNLNEATKDVFEGNKEIEDLKRENEQLKNKLKEQRTGTKSNPTQIFKERVAKATGEVKNAYDLLMKPAKQALLPNEMGALITVMEDMIRGGVGKAADVFEVLSAKINPKFAEGFEEAYLAAQENVGGKKETIESVRAAAEETNNAIAKKIADNNAKIEAAKRKKQQNAPLNLAQRIKKDADDLAFPKTKKQADALTVMLRELQKKAKDFYKSDNAQKNKSGIELLNFAGKNLEESTRIWNEAKAAVDTLIDNDANYTDAEKEQLKDFLKSYQDSIFDTLLSENRQTQIVKEALKEKGFIDEQGNVDWRSIIGKANSTEAAKSVISDWVKENTNLTQSQTNAIVEQLFRRYDNIVREKIEKQIANLMKKKKLGKGVSPKIDRLIMLSEQGMLNDTNVKSVLAEQFGIINLTDEQQAEFKQLTKEYANAPAGFLKAMAGENLEGFLDRAVYGPRIKNTWDYLKGEATLAIMNMPSVYTMRFYGAMTHLKNMSSFIDVVAKTLLNAIQTRDVRGLKVVFKELEYAMAAFRTVLQSGDVGTSSSTSNELAAVGRKYPVRTMEQRSPKAFGVIPDYFVSVGNKTFNVNLLNSLLKREKFNPRLAEAVDSFNWSLMSASEQYKFLVAQAKWNDPTLSNRQANDIAYEKMYGGDRDVAEKQARSEFKAMGKVPTKAQLTRRTLEILIQGRSEESRAIAEKISDEVTYKNKEITGVFNGIGALVMRAKSSINQIIEEKYKGDPSRKAKVLNKVASLFTNTLLPFVNGVANILERAAEFDPIYGATKSITYLGSSFNEKDQIRRYQLKQRAIEYISKATTGFLLMVMIEAMLEASDDDDTYITGSKTFTGQKPNTLKVFGTAIPLEAFGSVGLFLSQYADIRTKLLEEERKTGNKASYISPSAYKEKLRTISEISFLQNLKNGIDAILLDDDRAAKKYLGGTISNIVFPFTGTSRQLRNYLEPEAKTRETLYDEILNSSGVYGNWLLKRPDYDIFGEKYNRGERYNLTGDFSQQKPKTEWQKLYAKRGINLAKPLKEDEAITKAKYPIVVEKDGKEDFRLMTDEEFDDFRQIAGKAYKNGLEDYYKKYKDFAQKGEVSELKKDLSKTRTAAINYALYEVNKKYGNVDDNSVKSFLKTMDDIKGVDKPSKSGYKINYSDFK